jgi:thiol-disulfide isomerase/thioredoxin
MTELVLWTLGNCDLFGILDLGIGAWSAMKKRQQSWWKYLAIVSLSLGLSFFLFQCTRERSPEQTLAPDFKLATLEGQEVALSALKGKVVLLDFWATWCAPCREAIPHLIDLHKTFRQNGLEVIGMSVDKGEGETVRRFVKSMDIPYSIIITPEGVQREYGVVSLPTTILIDREGKIRQKFVGFTSEISKQLTGMIEELTAEKPSK